jgi:hypothetical protein
VITASIGFEYLEKLKLGFEGLILMKIIMPEMNG